VQSYDGILNYTNFLTSLRNYMPETAPSNAFRLQQKNKPGKKAYPVANNALVPG